MMNIFQQLRARWLEAGTPANEGVTQANVERFEEKHGIVLPTAFKEYLLTINGMEDGKVDENLVSFLSFGHIDQESNIKEVSADEVDLLFAEYSLYCHWYVLRTTRMGDRSRVFAADGEHEKQIASSFEEFVGNYLSNPTKVAHCWE